MLEYKDVSKALGVYINNKLNWNAHIDKVDKKYSGMIATLRKASFVPAKTLEEIYYQMVIPEVTYGMFIWDTCTQNIFEKIEKQHVKVVQLIKNIPMTVESNRVLDKVGLDLIIHIYKRKVAIEMYKILKEEDEHRLGVCLKKLKIREGELEVARMTSEFQSTLLTTGESLFGMKYQTILNKQIVNRSLGQN